MDIAVAHLRAGLKRRDERIDKVLPMLPAAANRIHQNAQRLTRWRALRVAILGR